MIVLILQNWYSLYLRRVQVGFASMDGSVALHHAMFGVLVNAVDMIKVLFAGCVIPSFLLLSDDHVSPMLKKKEYLVNLFLSDVKNNIYVADEFWMCSFEIQLCSRASPYDCTECFFFASG